MGNIGVKSFSEEQEFIAGIKKRVYNLRCFKFFFRRVGVPLLRLINQTGPGPRVHPFAAPRHQTV